MTFIKDILLSYIKNFTYRREKNVWRKTARIYFKAIRNRNLLQELFHKVRESKATNYQKLRVGMYFVGLKYYYRYWIYLRGHF